MGEVNNFWVEVHFLLLPIASHTIASLIVSGTTRCIAAPMQRDAIQRDAMRRVVYIVNQPLGAVLELRVLTGTASGGVASELAAGAEPRCKVVWCILEHFLHLTVLRQSLLLCPYPKQLKQRFAVLTWLLLDSTFKILYEGHRYKLCLSPLQREHYLDGEDCTEPGVSCVLGGLSSR